ncbi:MAG TPA: DUF2510 domain-containing protein [Mycobacteriales bacterium]|nr:DUF2510 domain-containing protein [Mycobacteriales bacterium]
MTDAFAASSAAAPAPAAWYPDPSTPGQLRWFDGVQWTGHVHPAAPPQYGTVPPWGAAPAERNRSMEALLPVNRSGLAIAAGYAGLFAILIVCAPIALVLGVLALRDLRNRPTVGGRGRAWFGVVAGGLGTLVLIGAMIA